MMRLKSKHQQGLSVISLLIMLTMLGVCAALAIRVVPTVTEYMAIKRAMVSSRESGSSVREIEAAFDRQASVSYIESISGKDLEITKNGDNFEISFAYQKKIPLIGPASLILDYAGTTASIAVK